MEKKLSRSEIQRALGDEFIVREDNSFPYQLHIELRLSSRTALSNFATADEVRYARDRTLIEFKRILIRLLLKYLGEDVSTKY